jgi:hypothetical protein
MAADKPPAYEDLPGSSSSNSHSHVLQLHKLIRFTEPRDSKTNEPQETTHLLIPTASGFTPTMPSTRVYHYRNPVTAEEIVSLLPPNHPAMVCLQSGEHVPETKVCVQPLFL